MNKYTDVKFAEAHIQKFRQSVGFLPALVSKITVRSFVKKWLLPLGLTSTDSAAGQAIQKKIDISCLHDNMIKYILYSETMKVALGNEINESLTSSIFAEEIFGIISVLKELVKSKIILKRVTETEAFCGNKKCLFRNVTWNCGCEFIWKFVHW